MEYIKKLPIEILSDDPQLIRIQNFLNKSQCNNIIEQATPILRRAMVEDKEGVKISKGRTNETCFIETIESQEITYLKNKLFKLFPLNSKDLTKIQVLRYKKDEKYIPHFDAYESKMINLKSGKQRFLTFLIYLSDDFKGGETFFPLLDIEIKPARGDLLVFKNCFNKTNFVHPKSLHESKTIKFGTKWAINFWSYKDITL